MPPNDYCACHALPDEWMSFIPNLKEYNEKIENLILLNRSHSEGISELESGFSRGSKRRSLRSPRKSIRSNISNSSN